MATTSMPVSVAAPSDRSDGAGADLAGALTACCTPLAAAPLSAGEAERLAVVLKAIAVPARLRLLSMICARGGGEACVCELTEPLGLTQPTVSHHLKVLVEAGLISRDKRGVWAYYRPVPGALAALGALFGGPGQATAQG
ncbi:helix-turn-helix transcriptional regulator [Frankia sp. AgB32]|uniref:ArsR/SmtB family transcription factor n=1 Tax=Frankia sp. AgB32 TaxID=631119 RepID=UPI00201096D5|nr:metalloregulator ArsR/SmtB family transcription factor [Frankia sp. AgB32]MCK9896998.1 metalloregulator ArsR/SmtB family transcription factor [Frankia sp. AgB32]